MNYYNLLYSVALSAFFAFSPACAMDVSTLDESSDEKLSNEYYYRNKEGQIIQRREDTKEEAAERKRYREQLQTGFYQPFMKPVSQRIRDEEDAALADQKERELYQPIQQINDPLAQSIRVGHDENEKKDEGPHNIFEFRKAINSLLRLTQDDTKKPVLINSDEYKNTVIALDKIKEYSYVTRPLSRESVIENFINKKLPLTKDNVKTVKDIIFTTYFAQNPDKLCPELQSITQTINQNPQDKKDLLTLLAIKGKQADPLTKNRIDQISPLIAAADIDFMNMRTINRTISQICSQQAPEPDLFSSLPQEVPAEREKNISEKVSEIVEQSIPNRDKATQLNSLYTALLSTKPNERKELAIWLKKEEAIKSAYKKLKQKVKAPVTSAEDFNSQFNDLNKSVLFSSGSADIPEPSPIEVFKSSYDYIIHNIDSLKNNDWLLENTKATLADNLERMMLFIHDHDLNPKEKGAPYESHRCWVLTLIKNTIFLPGPLTEEQIGELKKQIVAVNKTTQASLEAKSKGNTLYNSELGVNTHLAEENQPAEKIQPTTNVSQEQDITNLREILKQQEEGLTDNLYDPKILKEYHATLKKYRNLVESPRQKNEIAKLIKTTNKKIKQINIIAPKKPKTLDKKSPKEVAAIQRSQKPQDPLKARVPFESNTEKQLQEDIITDIENRRDKMTESELESAIFFLEDILNNRPNKKSADLQEIVALINDLYANKNAFQNIAQMTSEKSTPPMEPQTLTGTPKEEQSFVIDHPTDIAEKPIATTQPQLTTEFPPTIVEFQQQEKNKVTIAINAIQESLLQKSSSVGIFNTEAGSFVEEAKAIFNNIITIAHQITLLNEADRQKMVDIGKDENFLHTFINNIENQKKFGLEFENFARACEIIHRQIPEFPVPIAPSQAIATEPIKEGPVESRTNIQPIVFPSIPATTPTRVQAPTTQSIPPQTTTTTPSQPKQQAQPQQPVVSPQPTSPQPEQPTWTWWNPISWVTATTSWVFNRINSLFSWLMGR